MKTRFFTAAALLCIFRVNGAGAEPNIVVSYQPALYWAFPFYVASQRKYWDRVGLKPKFVTYPAGAPQVEAVKDGAWDVGGTGSIPAIIGASKYGLRVVGVTNLESQINSLMVSSEKYDTLKAHPELLKGSEIVLSTKSTADYSVRACLKRFGVSVDDVKLRHMSQADIVTGFKSGDLSVVGVWAPYSYILTEKVGARYLCNGAEAGVVVPGALVASAAFADKHPDRVAKFVAVYLRSWVWIKTHRDEARTLMRSFYKQGGVDISDASLDAEFATRPTFGLKEQAGLFNRRKGDSEVDRWYGLIGSFMDEGEVLKNPPAPKSFATEAFLTKIKDSPKLLAFASDTDEVKSAAAKSGNQAKTNLSKLLKDY